MFPWPQEIVRPIIARAPQMRPSRANTNWMLGWWGLGIWHLTYIPTPHSWLFWYIVYKATSNPQKYGKSVPPGWWAWYLHIFTEPHMSRFPTLFSILELLYECICAISPVFSSLLWLVHLQRSIEASILGAMLWTKPCSTQLPTWQPSR